MGMRHDDDDISTLDAEPPSPDLSRRITIVAHPQLGCVGRFVALEAGAQLVLGRKSEVFGAGVLDQASVSRRHAQVRLDGHGHATVEDLGSHNGTFLEGERIRGPRAIASRLVSMGPVVLAVEPQLPAFLPGRTLEVAAALLHRGRPVHLVGEAGVGKRWMATALQRLQGERPPLWIELQAGAEPPSMLSEPVEHGCVVVTRLDRATEAQAVAVAEAIERWADRPSLALIFTSRTPPSPFSAAGEPFVTLRGHLAPFSVELPPLRHHPGRTATLLAAFARRYAGPEVVLDPRLVIRLLGHGWPGNVRELEAIVERVAVESRAGDPLASFAELDAILASPARPELISTFGGTLSTDAFEVARDGSRFRCPDGTEHDLRSRRALKRIVAALVQAHRARPGTPVTVAELLDAAWPGEQLQAKAGANRVYVAMTNLRKLGLRALVMRGEGGYSISTEVALRVADR